MNPPKITTAYIKSIYNIDYERQSYKKEILHETIKIEPQEDMMSVSEYSKQINKQLSRYEGEDIIKIDYYGHDGAFDLNVYTTYGDIESDIQVINRLKKQEGIKKIKQKKIQNAIKLLKDEGVSLES